jgi:hypothetical protein
MSARTTSAPVRALLALAAIAATLLLAGGCRVGGDDSSHTSYSGGPTFPAPYPAASGTPSP